MGGKLRNVRRLLAVEPLEQRSMLAGVVTVFEAGGNLFVRGDNRDNCVLVYQTDDNEYAVAACDEDTDIRRRRGGFEEDNTVVFDGIDGNIDIHLFRGNDTLGVLNDLDQLAEAVPDIDIPEGFELDPPPVEDTFEVPRHLIINLDRGDDEVAVFADVGRNAIINTASGEDLVGIFDSNVGDLLLVLTGDGEDDLEVDTVDARHAVINTGSHTDEVGLFDFVVDRNLTLLLGSGSDFLFAAGVDVGNLAHIDAGSGNDDVEIEFSSANRLHVFMQSGNDTLTISNSSANRALLHGGSGFDTLNRGPGNDFDDLDIFSFEDINNGLTLTNG